MIAYVDASVVLRVVLRQPNALREWTQIDRGVSSALVTTESLRTLDRLRLRAQLSDSKLAPRRQAVLALIASLELVEIDGTVLDRAAQPMPTELGTLEAIHLASALLFRESTGEELMMATHDRALALGAQAHGIRVIGSLRKARFIENHGGPAPSYAPRRNDRG
jgi:predicted nucleic acid-binding protein